MSVDNWKAAKLEEALARFHRALDGDDPDIRAYAEDEVYQAAADLADFLVTIGYPEQYSVVHALRWRIETPLYDPVAAVHLMRNVRIMVARASGQ